MLLQFEVENFQSFKERQIFSLVASKYYRDHEDLLIQNHVPSLSGQSFLPAAVLFGPNASGKSNFIKAVSQLKLLVLRSATVTPDSLLPYTPFMLDSETRKDPTVFSVSFVVNNVRYDYEVAYNANEVLFEELLAYPNGRKQTLFVRRATTDNDIDKPIEVNPSLKVNKMTIGALRRNVLLLSLGAQLNNAKLLEIYSWFRDKLQLADTGYYNMQTLLDYSTDVLLGKHGEDSMLSLLDMLHKADFGISSARAEQLPVPPEAIESFRTLLNDDVYHTMLKEDSFYSNVLFRHSNGKESIELDIDTDSAGTKQFFTLLGPLLDVLEKGMILFIDEFDSSLHPLLSEELVSLFQSPKTNPNAAQLVITSHNMQLLDNSIFRRDQIWFTEKDARGASRLYPLSDYRPRKDESLLMGYIKGRYGALPLFPDDFYVTEEILFDRNE